MQVFVEKLGLTPLQAIKSATLDAAKALRKDGEVGLLKKGYLADILVINGDPSKDVTILGNKELIKNVFLNGKEIDLTPPLERVKDPEGWRVSSYSERILKKNSKK